MQPINPAINQIITTVFDGLSKDDLYHLYHSAQLKKLKAGDILFTENDTSQIVYVILSGEISIVKENLGIQEEIAVLREGSWVGEITFSQRIPRNTRAEVKRPSTVLGIDEALLSTFNERLQLFIYKQLNQMAAERIMDVMKEEKLLEQKNTNLLEYFFSIHDKEHIDYTNSEIIADIIRNIPRLPIFGGALAMKVLEDKISPKEISEILKLDPSLTSSVLKRVNAPDINLQERVADIHRAVLLLGFKNLYQIFVAESTKKFMPDTPHFRELHTRMISTSFIAYALAAGVSQGNPIQISTTGLLVNIGEVVIYLLKNRNKKLSLLIDAIDHSQMGSLLLKEWNLPDVIWQTISYVNYPVFAPPSKIPEHIRINVGVLYLSRLALEFIQGNSIDDMKTIFLQDYLRMLSSEVTSVETLVQQVILPGLVRNLDSYPDSFRNMLKKHIFQLYQQYQQYQISKQSEG
ncbi:MAG: HDOD domain-containing protein [Desulfobacterales bacterium]|nr:HDOD domain-containing protein [Desulfobacterales bacterium]